MKNKLQFIPTLLVLCIFFLSCTNKEKEKDLSKVTNRILKVDCESMIPKCGNKPGLKFYGERLGMWRESLVDGEGDYERVPYEYIVCCEYVPGLIDTLKKADSLREAWIREKPEFIETNFAFGSADDSIYVGVYYKNRWSDAEPDPFFYLSFGNPTQAPTFYISRKEFAQLMKDIEERFRTCCLQ